MTPEDAPPDLLPPVLPGTAASDYERYLRTDELLALQKAPGEMLHRDELLFTTVQQSSELWLKLACFELETAIEQVSRREVAAALRLLRRVVLCLELVTGALELLERMTPWDFHEVRRALGHGSGFDSPGWARLRRLLPGLGQELQALLRERGLTVVSLYQHDREHEELFQLAELAIELDERATLWRLRHFKVVERLIGGEVIGTQGTPVELLRPLLDRRVFPELWAARTQLTKLAWPDENALE